MSFFGLTAFGPENFIRSSLVDSNGFTLFSEEEFKSGFEKVSKYNESNEKVLRVSDVKKFLHYTFNFTPLDEEVKVFTQNCLKTDYLTWEEVKLTIESIKANLNSKAESSKKYTSFTKLSEDTYKHKRKETSPNDVFKSPVTYGHGYGFNQFSDRTMNEIKFPMKKCDETRYAESIILTGNKFSK